jgi:hypothetical protein
MSREINENYPVVKEDILGKYQNMDLFFQECIEALYGKENEININCFLPRNIIKNKGNNDLSSLGSLEGKTGIYIFLDSESIPVYIGIGGQKVNGQDLKIRLAQELRAYVTKNEKTKYARDTGATLSKNIQVIDKLLMGNNILPDNSIETIKKFNIIALIVGEINEEENVLKARALETVLISLYGPKYNK